jgi:phosphatidylglycerophosphate synthase
VATIKEIKEVCGITSKDDHWRERIARFISIRITKFLLYIPKITPNQVTVLMLIVGLVSVVFFLTGNYIHSLIGILLYHLYLILDACDGEIARYKKMYSKRGLYLDYMGHVIINPLLIMAMGIGAFFNNLLPIPDYVFLIAGLIGMYTMMINNFVKLKKYEMYLDSGDFKILKDMQKKFKSQDDQGSAFMDEVWRFFRIMTFNSIFFFGILGLLPYLVLIYGVLLPLQALKRFYSETMGLK